MYFFLVVVCLIFNCTSAVDHRVSAEWDVNLCSLIQSVLFKSSRGSVWWVIFLFSCRILKLTDHSWTKRCCHWVVVTCYAWVGLFCFTVKHGWCHCITIIFTVLTRLIAAWFSECWSCSTLSLVSTEMGSHHLCVHKPSLWRWENSCFSTLRFSGYVQWVSRGGVVVRASDLQPVGRRFESLPLHFM